METPSAFAPDLRFELRVALTLRPDGLGRAWQADLVDARPGQPPVHFDSLPDLIRYLAVLDTAPSRGIR